MCRRTAGIPTGATWSIALALLWLLSGAAAGQASEGTAFIRNVLAKTGAAAGYEVDVDRIQSRLSEAAPASELRAVPKARVMTYGQEQRAFRYSVKRVGQGRIQNRRIPTNPRQQRQAASSEDPQPTPSDTAPEAVFTIDPEDLFVGIDQATVTEISRDTEHLVLRIEMPTGVAPAPDWPEMWLRATFDRHRDLLLKSELMVEGEARIISDFDYRQVDGRHWLPSRKDIRIIEKQGVTVIEDTYGPYRKTGSVSQ